MRSTWRVETMVLPEQIEQNFEGQCFLISTNSRLWPVNGHLIIVEIKMGAVKCRCNLSLTTGSVDQSKNAWKGSALNQIHTLLALVHTTHTPLSLQPDYSDLLKLRPPKHKQAATWSTSWRDDKRESCQTSEHSQNTVRNMTTAYNLVTLPINLYALDPPVVQPLNLTKLGDHHSDNTCHRKK